MDEATGFELEELSDDVAMPALHCTTHCHMGSSFELEELSDDVAMPALHCTTHCHLGLSLETDDETES